LDEKVKNILDGRKTFFIAPDLSLLPENYLEDYLEHGYEAYIITDDAVCPLQNKIEIIISVFKDSILFFYIDTKVPGLDWEKLIKNLQAKYADRILIGVLYTKRKTEIEQRNLEKYYLFDVGIQCGCIAMEYQKSKNFTLIDRVLFENQASGRRKNIRAICDDSCKITFNYNGKNYNGRIQDISMSHFSCLIDQHPFEMPVFTKVPGILFIVQGIHFRSDAILSIQRKTENETLQVFLFSRFDGMAGLDTETRPRLLTKIYQMVTDDGKELLRGMFETYGKRLRDGTK